MLRLIATLVLTISAALPSSAQERNLRWQNLDPTTIASVEARLAAAGFELDGMRPLTLIVSAQACRVGCTVREAGCACPKTGNTCPNGTSESPGGALCLGPLPGVQVMLEDGRISGSLDLP